MKRLVTIAVFQYPHHAYVLKGRLESEGIQATLRDELTIQADNFLSNAIGGVKLQVFEQDVQSAMLVMEDGGFDTSLIQEPQQEPLSKILKRIIITFFIVAAIVSAWILFQMSGKKNAERDKEIKAERVLHEQYLPYLDTLAKTNPALMIYHAKLLLENDYHHNPDIEYRIINAYIQMDSLRDALHWLNKHPLQNPSPRDYWNMAYCYYHLDQKDSAVFCIKMASRQNSDFLIDLGQLYEELDSLVKADSAYSQYIRHRESGDSRAFMDENLLRLKTYRDAVRQKTSNDNE